MNEHKIRTITLAVQCSILNLSEEVSHPEHPKEGGLKICPAHRPKGTSVRFFESLCPIITLATFQMQMICQANATYSCRRMHSTM